MLASTVQFSNNDQPQPHRHHTPPHNTGQQFDDQARPDTRRQPTPTRGLFPQDPTGCPNTATSRTTTPVPHPHPTKGGTDSTRPVAVAGTDFTSVSAIEHPTDHIRGDAGSWTPFAGQAAP